jgi:hypothetical protein
MSLAFSSFIDSMQIHAISPAEHKEGENAWMGLGWAGLGLAGLGVARCEYITWRSVQILE